MFVPFVLSSPHYRAILGRRIVDSIYYNLEYSNILAKNKGFCS